MVWLWPIFWLIFGIALVLAVLSFVNPAIRILVKNFLFFVETEIKGWFYNLHEAVFGPVPTANIRPVPIDAAVVNSPKNGYTYADCPGSVWVRCKVNFTLDVEVGGFQEKCMWYCWPGVEFHVGKQTGRIKRVIVKYRYLRNRGQFFRNACGETEWPKYFTSVVLAHIEVLKFSQRNRSHHPTLIGRIFKHYGENLFQDVA